MEYRFVKTAKVVLLFTKLDIFQAAIRKVPLNVCPLFKQFETNPKTSVGIWLYWVLRHFLAIDLAKVVAITTTTWKISTGILKTFDVEALALDAIKEHFIEQTIGKKAFDKIFFVNCLDPAHVQTIFNESFEFLYSTQPAACNCQFGGNPVEKT
jgi:hypothetical protein